MKHIIYVFILLILFSCEDKKEEVSESSVQVADKIILSAEKIDLAGIVTGKLQSKKISEKIYCKGRIMAKPQNRVKYSAPVEGYIKRIFIQNGKKVNRGSLLITLEHPNFISLQKDFLKVRSNLEYLEQEFERQRVLNESNAGKKKDFQKIKSEYEQAKVEFSAFKLELRMININPDKLNFENIRSTVNLYAPISGNVNEVNISIGQYVNNQNVLFEIINNDDFYIELDVFERDIHKITINQKLTYDCSIPESRDSIHTAEIVSVGNYIDPVTKTFKVHAKPLKFEPGMRHGIFINAQINLSEASVNVVPDEAVIREGENTYIFTFENDSVFIKKLVQTGIQTDGFTEILNDDLSDKLIVLQGANYIKADSESE